MTSYTKDYLKMIREHVDEDACIDSNDNVVYIDQHVITVPPEDCKRIMNEMAGVEEYVD